MSLIIQTCDYRSLDSFSCPWITVLGHQLWRRILCFIHVPVNKTVFNYLLKKGAFCCSFIVILLVFKYGSNLLLLCPLLYPPANYVCWWGILFSCPSVFPSVCPSIRPSVTFWFFFNILKRQWWKFIKFCRHIDIDKMYVYNRKLRARGQFCCSYCPL